jgi:hypothetical protein
MSNKEEIQVMNENFKNKCVVNEKSFIDKSCRKISKTKKSWDLVVIRIEIKLFWKSCQKWEENEKIFLYWMNCQQMIIQLFGIIALNNTKEVKQIPINSKYFSKLLSNQRLRSKVLRKTFAKKLKDFGINWKNWLNLKTIWSL